MPHVFTFGIPKYFNFTFRAGPQSPSLADETVDVDSDSKDTTDPEASKVLKTLPISSPEDTYPEARNEVKPPVLRPLFATASSPCGTLSKFPLEIRIMVYKSVLHFKKQIRQAHRFLERYPPIMAKDSTHIEAIDAVLLRTCRTVYQEAVHILYGMNRFYFSKPTELEDFAHMGLGKKPFGCYRTASEPASAVGNSPCGRLTMIRFMTLDMSHGSVGDDRKKLWSLWRAFFYPSENQDQLVSFPALEWLALDLTDWALVSEDASKVRVKPFLKRLRPTGGLRHLTLIGVSHEQNLRDFKHGFVKQGGTFRPASSNNKTVPTTTVTHDDLPEVSMYVRAIVEKDRAS